MEVKSHHIDLQAHTALKSLCRCKKYHFLSYPKGDSVKNVKKIVDISVIEHSWHIVASCCR